MDMRGLSCEIWGWVYMYDIIWQCDRWMSRESLMDGVFCCSDEKKCEGCKKWFSEWRRGWLMEICRNVVVRYEDDVHEVEG